MGSNCYRSRRFGVRLNHCVEATMKWPSTFMEDLTFAQIKPAKINLSLFWQVLGLPGAGGFDVDVLAGYGVREGHAVGVEHQATGTRCAVKVVTHQGMTLAG